VVTDVLTDCASESALDCASATFRLRAATHIVASAARFMLRFLFKFRSVRWLISQARPKGGGF